MKSVTADHVPGEDLSVTKPDMIVRVTGHETTSDRCTVFLACSVQTVKVRTAEKMLVIENEDSFFSQIIVKFNRLYYFARVLIKGGGIVAVIDQKPEFGSIREQKAVA